jgi:peroxiredoxin
VVLAVSADADTTQMSWARDASFPFLFVSDSSHVIDNLYGSTSNSRTLRNLFVIGPDGRIAHRITPFVVLSQDAYVELERAVDRSAGVAGPG